MATTEGNTVRGGKIASTICKYLELSLPFNKQQNDKKNWKKFGVIYKKASRDIASNTCQYLTVTEHDTEIDDVIFFPFDESVQGIHTTVVFYRFFTNFF